MALPHGAMGCLQLVIVVFPDHTHLLFWPQLSKRLILAFQNWKFRDKLGEMDGLFVCLFDLILYVHSTIFQLCGTFFLG